MIPIEVFVSAAGVFIATAHDSPFFEAQSLHLSIASRTLRLPDDTARSARLSPSALDALRGVSHVPIAAFTLGGVTRAVVKTLTVVE